MSKNMRETTSKENFGDKKMDRCASKLRRRQQNATEAGSKILEESIAYLETSLAEKGGKDLLMGQNS